MRLAVHGRLGRDVSQIKFVGEHYLCTRTKAERADLGRHMMPMRRSWRAPTKPTLARSGTLLQGRLQNWLVFQPNW